MGNTSYSNSLDRDNFRSYRTSTTLRDDGTAKDTADIFTRDATKVATEGLHPTLDPLNVAIRESRDSAIHPAARAVILACDVSGSMGIIADHLIRGHADGTGGLDTVFRDLIDRKVVTDPHVMIMAVDDYEATGKGTIQISQFEADPTTLSEQLKEVWLVHGGGGNNHESYLLPLYFAARHTSIDCLEKRGQKGFLFTIGDEEPHMLLHRHAVKSLIGDSLQADISAADMIEQCSRMYEIFHVIIEEGSHVRTRGIKKVFDPWNELLPQRVIKLSDHTKLGEVIVSAIQVLEGVDKDKVAKSWSGATSVVVADAVRSLTPAAQGDTRAGGLHRFK